MLKQFLIFVLCVLLSVPVFAKGPKSPNPMIVSVIVNSNAGEIQIFGSGFDNPEVSLGEMIFPPPHILSSSDELIVAIPDLDAGDYKLILNQGKKGKDQVEYDLTIGAAGPAGPKGEQGQEGEQGPAGPAGQPDPQFVTALCDLYDKTGQTAPDFCTPCPCWNPDLIEEQGEIVNCSVQAPDIPDGGAFTWAGGFGCTGTSCLGDSVLSCGIGPTGQGIITQSPISAEENAICLEQIIAVCTAAGF